MAHAICPCGRFATHQVLLNGRYWRRCDRCLTEGEEDFLLNSEKRTGYTPVFVERKEDEHSGWWRLVGDW
jgi:hypothetical protein